MCGFNLTRNLDRSLLSAALVVSEVSAAHLLLAILAFHLECVFTHFDAVVHLVE